MSLVVMLFLPPPPELCAGQTWGARAAVTAAVTPGCPLLLPGSDPASSRQVPLKLLVDEDGRSPMARVPCSR